MRKFSNRSYPLKIKDIIIVLAVSVLLLGLYSKVDVQGPRSYEYRNASANDIIWYSAQSLANNTTDDAENYNVGSGLSFTNQPDAVGNYMMLTFPAEHYTIEQIHLAVYCTMSSTGNVTWTGYLKTMNCDGVSDGDAGEDANMTQQWSGAVTETNVATATWRLVTFNCTDETTINENAELWQFKWYISTAGNCTGAYYAAVGVEFGG